MCTRSLSFPIPIPTFSSQSTLTFSHEQEDDEDTQRRMANVKQSRAELETTGEKILLALSSNVAEVRVCLCVCGAPTENVTVRQQ